MGDYGMKRKISFLLLIALLLSATSLLLTSCGNKKVPVYRGISISDGSFTSFAGALQSDDGSSTTFFLCSNKEEGEEKSYGQYEGDHVKRDEALDSEKLFSESNYQQNMNNAFGYFDPSSGGIHFAPEKPSELTIEEIFVTVHLDNPDNFPIVSFLLNDNACSSDKYEQSSTMEEIVVKTTITHTATSKICSITIGSIKYMDDDGEVKDVIMGGNDTEEITPNEPLRAAVTDISVGDRSVSFNVNLNESKITFIKGEMRAFIFGKGIQSMQDIFLGDNSVTFNNLMENGLYQIIIAGYYDDLTGNGFRVNVLYHHAFYTPSPLLFDNIEIGEEEISFDYLRSGEEDREITALKLYMEGLYVGELDVDTTVVDGLLPGTTYKIVAEFPGEGQTDSIYLEFTTLEKADKG